MSLHFWRQERFAFLLVTLVSFLVIFPVIPEGTPSVILLRVFYTGIVGTGVWVLEQNPRLARPGNVLATLALVFVWGTLIFETPSLILIGRAILWSFFILTTVQLVLYLARTPSVDLNMILASVCAYVMMGFVFGIVYEVTELRVPGAFDLTIPGAVDQTGELIYFSFVTLTTLGYGDVTPVLPIARSIAILEAICGQFYVAIIVARLISLSVSKRASTA